MTLNPQNWGFSNFFATSGYDRHFKSEFCIKLLFYCTDCQSGKIADITHHVSFAQKKKLVKYGFSNYECGSCTELPLESERLVLKSISTLL